MKRKMNKATAVLCAAALALLFGLFPTPAMADENTDVSEIGAEAPTYYAADEETASNADEAAATADDASATVDEAANANEAEAVDNITAADGTAEAADDVPEKATNGTNIFTEIYDACIANAGMILSALSFAVSLALTLIYKKGLIPMISRATGTMKNGIKAIGESLDQSRGETTDMLSGQGESIGKIGGELEKIAGEIKELSDKVGRVEDDMSSRESIRIIMQGQIDMLYDIFMSSALPQYKKDDVGTRISAMKEQLTKNA